MEIAPTLPATADKGAIRQPERVATVARALSKARAARALMRKQIGIGSPVSANPATPPSL